MFFLKGAIFDSENTLYTCNVVYCEGYFMASPSVALLEICVPSAWFLRNNIKKVQNGDDARSTVVFAQGAKIAEAVKKYHDKTPSSAMEACNVFGKYAEKSKVLNCAGKTIDWAARNVNPLICMSAIYKTATADEKVKTGVTQLGALSGMFVGEGLMKRNMDKVINEQNIIKVANKIKDVKGVGKLAQRVLESNASGKIAAVLKGISFVLVSMTSYDLGEKLAKHPAEKICTNLGINDKHKNDKKIDQKA